MSLGLGWANGLDGLGVGFWFKLIRIRLVLGQNTTRTKIVIFAKLRVGFGYCSKVVQR